MLQNHPSVAHERRRALLDVLGRMAGYGWGPHGGFPDRRQPDVLRYDPRCRSIFVGEAKETESPGCAATRERLRGYLLWMRAITRLRGAGTLAVCAGDSNAAIGWANTLRRLAEECKLPNCVSRAAVLDDDAVVIWISFGHRAHVL